ncbi:M15 family metallopeptidase [Ignatzschineria sp. LJL83]
MEFQKWQLMPVMSRDLVFEKSREILIDTTSHFYHDPLVQITSSARLKVYSAYYHDHIQGALKEVYTRSRVLEKLEELLKKLPESLGILVLDAWRPIAVQEALRADFKKQLEQDYPDFTEAVILDVLNQFVALSSLDPLKPSPHLTGGSIDLTLFSVETGIPLNMGTDFDAMLPSAWSSFFEDRILEKEEREIQRNRRILIHGMESVGFSNLPSEWWHFDYGNQLWGYYYDQVAFYSIAKVPI